MLTQKSASLGPSSHLPNPFTFALQRTDTYPIYRSCPPPREGKHRLWAPGAEILGAISSQNPAYPTPQTTGKGTSVWPDGPPTHHEGITPHKSSASGKTHWQDQGETWPSIVQNARCLPCPVLRNNIVPSSTQTARPSSGHQPLTQLLTSLAPALL